jgi:tRNA A-37 threonylcarbamoyl transferase component Bud32
MASKRLTPKSFPVNTFVQQYNAAFHGGIQASQVRVNELRSRKHATVELSISQDACMADAATRNTFVAKHFSDADKELLHHESVVYSNAINAGIPVPRVLHVLNNFIVLEKVEGSTLMDLINYDAVQLDHKKVTISSLGRWLSDFHSAFASHPQVRRRGDANLRNFIEAGTSAVVGFDFEEACLDDPVRDLHEAIDSILQSRPGIFTEGQGSIEWKYELCEWLLKSYAAAARKKPIEIIKDPERFVNTQLMVMRELATVRGSSSILVPRIPIIKKKVETIIDRLMSEDER